jgi:hypothetical protein
MRESGLIIEEPPGARRGARDMVKAVGFPMNAAEPPNPDLRMMPERAHWVIVVRADRPAAHARLQRHFARAPWVDVVIDRRGGVMDRRVGLASSRAPSSAGERRAGQRRALNGPPSSSPTFRRASRQDDFEVYEATAPLPARCPECGLTFTVELPHFAEPPIHLELTMIHDITLYGVVRHVVEAQSLSATGRVLFTSRLRARPLEAA